MGDADLREDLIKRRDKLVLRRNDLAHSIVVRNAKGDQRLWRPEHKGRPAHAVGHKDIEDFIQDVKSLRTDILREEHAKFGDLHD